MVNNFVGTRLCNISVSRAGGTFYSGSPREGGGRSIGMIQAAVAIGHSPLLELSSLFLGGEGYLVILLQEGCSIGMIQAAVTFHLILDTVCCVLR